jgi:hypothetical protein
MSVDRTRCPKCNGEMIQGFIVDRSQGGTRFVSSWVEGPPQKAFWSGTTASDANHVPVGTFRCSVCGFLESFARPDFGAK